MHCAMEILSQAHTCPRGEVSSTQCGASVWHIAPMHHRSLAAIPHTNVCGRNHACASCSTIALSHAQFVGTCVVSCPLRRLDGVMPRCCANHAQCATCCHCHRNQDVMCVGTAYACARLLLRSITLCQITVGKVPVAKQQQARQGREQHTCSAPGRGTGAMCTVHIHARAC